MKSSFIFLFLIFISLANPAKVEVSSSDLQQKYQILINLIEYIDGQPGNEENPGVNPDYQRLFKQSKKRAVIEALTSSDREVACQYKLEEVKTIDFIVSTIRSDKSAKEVIQILKDTVFKNETMDERLIWGIRLARKETANRIEAKECLSLFRLHFANGLNKQDLRDVLNEAIPNGGQ